MKKLLIGLCAASMLAASVAGYAGSVTFVNKYNQPVTFVVSKGPVYNPIVGGTVPAGERATLSVPGPFTSNHYFMAYAPYQSMIVTNCGSPLMPIDNVIVKAGWSRDTGMFTCHIYKPSSSVVKHEYKKTCHHK